MESSICSTGPASGWRRVGVLAAACMALLTTACEEKRAGNGAAPVAATVNNAPITEEQIDLVLQQQRGVTPQRAEIVSRQILQRLIDQELAAQKAIDLKLDRQPRVMLQLEMAKRELLSRAYLESIAAPAGKPSPEEVAKYYEATPALFKERRIYSLQELSIEANPEQIAPLRQALESAKNIGEFVEYLKTNDLRFTANQAVRAAEQLPLSSLGTFAAMKDGQSILSQKPTGAQVVVLAGSRSQPVTLEQATPAIEQFLSNERKREILTKDVKALRAAAAIQYAGKYAGAAASDAEAAASVPADAGSGVDGIAPKQ